MAKTTNVQTNFTAGQLDPRLFGRTDISKYPNGVKRMENFVSLLHGGAQNRMGTVFVLKAEDSDERSRLIPFQFNNEDAYVIELGNERARVFRDGQFVSDVGGFGTPYTITDATSTPELSFWIYRYTVSEDASGENTEDMAFVVEGVDPSDYNITGPIPGSVSSFIRVGQVFITSTALDDAGAYVSGGTLTVLEPNESPYTSAQLDEVSYTQSANVMYFVHPDVRPYTLTRISELEWSWDAIDFEDGPYMPVNTSLTNDLTLGTLSFEDDAFTATTATFDSVIGINGGQGLLSTDVGRLIRFGSGPAGTDHHHNWMIITAVNSTTTADVSVAPGDNAHSTSSLDWRLGSWSDTTGWPHSVVFYQNRLYYGGTDDQPQTLWGSEVGNFVSFSPSGDPDEPLHKDTDVFDTNAVTFTMNDDQVNAIIWMKETSRGLILGTGGGEHRVFSSNLEEAITPTNVGIKRQSTFGSRENIRPVQVGNDIIFVQPAGRKLRQLTYRFEQDALVAPELTLLAENITSGTVREIVYQQEPNSVVWALLEDGTLLSMTYEREQDIVAWATHTVGGTFDGGNAVVESIAVIRTDDHDQLWMSVKRTIDEDTFRSIEYMKKPFDGEALEDAVFVDMSGTYSGAPSTMPAVWPRLANEDVAVLADGVYVGIKTLDSQGRLTLDNAASVVTAGLPYTSTIETLPMVAVVNQGDMRMFRTSMYYAKVRFFETLGGSMGPSESVMQEIIWREARDAMDVVNYHTEIRDAPILDDLEHDTTFFIQQTAPLPMTVLSIISGLEVADGI